MKNQPKKVLVWSKSGITFDDDFTISLRPEIKAALDELLTISDCLYDLIIQCDTYAEAERIAKRALKSQLILAAQSLNQRYKGGKEH